MSHAQIKVYVVEMKGREFLQLRWTDANGHKRTKSTELSRKQKHDAQVMAAEKEKQLNRFNVSDDGSIDWESFRERLTEDVLSGTSAGNAEKVEGVLNMMEEFSKPSSLRDITGQYLSRYVGWLRKNSREESTIQSHMRHVKAVLRWAKKTNYLEEVPAIPVITRASKRKMMKGRPLTDAEATLYLKTIPEVVPAAHVRNYKFMTEGLDLSGLRLEEAMTLSWDTTAEFHVMVEGDRVKFMIPADADKGYEDQIFPTTPDCCELLLKVPKSQRVGFVFNPTYTNHRNGKIERYKNSSDVSRIFSAIGEKAGIIVDTKSGKFASAHDFRRRFGTRWKKMGVSSFLLKELMRHASIQTTELYYLEENADETQDEVEKLWNAKKLGNTVGNTKKKAAKRKTKKTQ